MKKQILMYHGERVNHFGAIYQLFKSQKGVDSHYSGIKNVGIGSCYAQEPGGKMKIRPELVEPPKGFVMSEKDELEAEAQREVVRHARAEKRKAMELRKPNQRIVQAVDLLRPFYRAMSHVDQRRFMGYLANECSKKKGRAS
jgi:hypothetical protein